VDVIDPHANSSEMEHEYGVGLTTNLRSDYDAIILAVNHREYMHLDVDYFKSILQDGKGIVVDVKGIYRNKINDLTYWSL
jgi:UDP-N-acetyl-D-galactosamine dehydrogenase